jgi:AcrR family transcriptional regulator
MTELELTRRERKKEETKERIAEVALDLFRRRGVEATTIEDICDKADVAKGTFFNYFPRKEAVFAFLSERWVAEAEQKIADALAKGVPAFKKIRDVFVDIARFYEEDRALSKHMALEWTREMYEPGNEQCRRWDELGQHVVRQLQHKGELRADVDPTRAHRILEDVYHGTIMMWLESPEPPYPLQDELRKRLDLAVQGLAPRA